jgi:hypothetical protein
MNGKALVATALVVMLVTPALRAASYSCVEVEIFGIDKSDIRSKQDKRAATIPREALEAIRQSIVLEIPLSVPGMVGVAAGEEACKDPARAVILGGTMSDYKKGSKAARYFIGMGAGKQKFAVAAWIRDKASGHVLGTDEIVDRKIGGLLGGSAEKGVDDFSEKVAKFIRRTLNASN